MGGIYPIQMTTEDQARKLAQHYYRIVIEKNSPEFGKIINNTKSPGKYSGMSKEEFTEATKYASCYNSVVKEA